ncbi:MAG TPA: multicopper oxidase domain-containing protein [Candidatus Methylomirabilis sp.]|nr:multicopper oxidase domain-containing protein [Candidatus Methylomirabilis sp.]
MAIHIIKSDRRRKEERVSRYMQEIRDIVKGGFDRRELLKMGLVLGGAGLMAMQGMRNFRPYWAYADDGGGLRLTSPPNTPFVDPLPIPQVMRPTRLNPAPTLGPNPVASALTGFTETLRPDHQRWTDFGGASAGPGFTGTEYEIVELPVENDFYPAVDGQPPSTLWTFVDATTLSGNPLSASLRDVRPLWVQARYGEPIVLRIHNALPVANEGFGINQTSTHLHNGHHASESDGGPVQFYDAGHFKDFHYANARAGFASTHPTSSLNGHTVIGDVHETMSFLWFHDHRFGFTAQNVHKGLVGFLTYWSDDIALDTGDETTGLRLPSGEFDIPMVFIDRTFDPAGRLFFDLFNLDGILGTKYTVNGKIQPFLEVKRRKYRFRILDGGPSRAYEFFLSNGQPFIQITNDGNLLPRPLTRRSVRLGVAERADVIVDFSGARLGDTIYLQNRLEQTSGRGPTGKIIAPTNLLQFRVVGDAPDDSQIPAALLDLPPLRAPVRTRRWDFGRDGGAWVINGEPFDPTVIRAFPVQNTAEEWVLNSGGGWMHPIHIHMEEFQITARDKGIPVEERSRKDVVRIGEAAVGTDDSEARVLHQFRDWLGDYPMHCHNTVHEDHAMLLRWQVVPA